MTFDVELPLASIAAGIGLTGIFISLSRNYIFKNLPSSFGFCLQVNLKVESQGKGEVESTKILEDEQQNQSRAVESEPEPEITPAGSGESKRGKAESKSAFVLGTGSAFANHYSSDELISAFHRQRDIVGDSQYDAKFVDNLFTKCGFDSNSIYASPENLFRTFNRDEYLSHRREALLDLAERAANKALNMWGGKYNDITHLVFGTMTGGIESPAVPVDLVKRLSLRYDTKIASIENMGCLTGFRVLSLGSDIAKSDASYRVLVVTADARSLLQNSLPNEAQREDIVSTALFRDSGSACVLGCNSSAFVEQQFYEVIATRSAILPDTEHLVDHKELKTGAIRLHLAKDLPNQVAAATPPFVSDLMTAAGKVSLNDQIPALTDFDILCHTGGPKVLKEEAKVLGVTDEQMASSWAVMKSHGNLSGSSNLCVLDHHNRSERQRAWSLGLSMGPGMCVEGVILRRISSPSTET